MNNALRNDAPDLRRVISRQWAPLEFESRPAFNAHYHLTAHLSRILAVTAVGTVVHVHGVGRSTERPYLDTCMCRPGSTHVYGGRVTFRWEGCDGEVLFVLET